MKPTDKFKYIAKPKSAAADKFKQYLKASLYQDFVGGKIV